MKNLLTLCFLLPCILTAQDKALIVEGNAPNFYLTHTTTPKETFYSIGRIYNISPKEIAPFNKLVLENGLSIGQVVKVPLKEVNFSVDGAATADEALVPVYLVVKEKQTLTNMSGQTNVPVATLKKWNNLKSDNVANGTKLVIGYLKVKKELSPLASKGVTVEKNSITEHAVIPVDNSTDIKPKPEVKEAVKEEKKEEKTKVVEVVKKDVNPVTGKSQEGGFFRNMYTTAGKTNPVIEPGTAGIFKSTSGWEDGKYYCLHNSAPAGTIVKITATANGKSVYAKVLDLIPDLKQNSGLAIRLSSAAASELGVSSEKFECMISY